MILVNGQSCENTFLMDQFLIVSPNFGHSNSLWKEKWNGWYVKLP